MGNEMMQASFQKGKEEREQERQHSISPPLRRLTSLSAKQKLPAFLQASILELFSDYFNQLNNVYV